MSGVVKQPSSERLIEIRHRWNNGILWSGQYENLRHAVEAAVLAHAPLDGANLDGANLVGARLDGANLAYARLVGARLDGANLDGANLDGAIWRDGIILTRRPLQLSGLDYPVIILDQHMQIGCELHTLAEWGGFDNERICRMDGRRARKFWDAHGASLLALAKGDGRGVVLEQVAA